MLEGQDHRRVEPDDGEAARDGQDRLDDLLADFGLDEVELGGVVPGEARSVVAVIDVTGHAGPVIVMLEHDRGVAVVPVVILEDDRNPGIGRQVGSVERVGRVWRFRDREEPLGVLDHPPGVDAHVVRHHVAGETDAARPGAIAQVCVGGLAADVVRDPVVIERVGRSHRVGVATPALDRLRRTRPLPQPDEPQPGYAPAREQVQLFVRDRVQRPDVALVALRQLVQPDVRALGHEDESGHPVRVGAESLGFGLEPRELRRLDGPGTAPAAEPEMQSALLLGQDAEGDIDAVQQTSKVVAQEGRPVVAHVAELAGQRGRGMACRRAQQGEEIEDAAGAIAGGKRRGSRKGRLQFLHGPLVRRGPDERAIVDQLPKGRGGRVLVYQPGQDHLPDEAGWVLRLGQAARERGGEAMEDAIALPAQPGAQALDRTLPDARQGRRLEAFDDEMGDLMEETEGRQIPGLDGRQAGRPRRVHPRRHRAGGRSVGQTCIPTSPDWCGIDPVEVLRCSRDANGGSVRPGLHPPRSWRIPRIGMATQPGRLFNS